MKAFAVIAALMLAGPAIAEPADPATLAVAPIAQDVPYQLDLVVEQHGREVVRIRTQITEDGPAAASATAGGVEYRFEASLWSVQGDGDQAQLALEARLLRDDEPVASPTLTFVRGKDAAIAVGREDGEILRMTVAPIS